MKTTVMNLALIIIVSAVFLVGCANGENSEIVGTWVPTTAMTNDETITYEELGIDENDFCFTFEANGSCTATLAGITSDSEYAFNGTSVDLTVNEAPYKLSYDGGKLTLVLTYDGETIQFSFTKQR